MDDLDARIDATKQVMKLAYQLRTPIVVNQVGRVPDDVEDPQWTTLVESLSDLGRHGERIGAFLAAQTGSEDGQHLRRLLDALETNAVGVAFHPGNLIVNGFSAQDAVEHLGERVVYVQAADGVRDLRAAADWRHSLAAAPPIFPS